MLNAFADKLQIHENFFIIYYENWSNLCGLGHFRTYCKLHVFDDVYEHERKDIYLWILGLMNIRNIAVALIQQLLMQRW